jgi:hypothetical protein
MHAWADVADQSTQSCLKEDLQYWGDPPAPGTHPVVAMVSVSPFWPKSPIQSFGRPSHLHALEQTLQIKSTQSCHKKDLQCWGDSHLPQGPIQWWQWSLEPILAKNPPCLSRPKPSPCVGADTLQIINSNHATGTSGTGTSTAPGTHPVVAVNYT